MLYHLTPAHALVGISRTDYDVLKPCFLVPIAGKIDARHKGGGWRPLITIAQPARTTAVTTKRSPSPFSDRNDKDAFVDLDRCEAEPRLGISAGSMAGTRFAHIEHCHNTIIFIGGNISTQD